MTPVWLMDVDGVLNINGWAASRVAQAWGDTRRFTANRFSIVVSPAMLARVEGWRAAGLIQVRWLTTWEDLANTELSHHLGWPDDLEVAGRREESQLERPRKLSESRASYREDVGWWKLEFAQAVYDTGVPVIWTDDDIAFAPDAQRWLADEADPNLIHAVAPKAGLTPTELDGIERFIRRWNGGPE